jgi:hypothetical protein
MNTFDTRDDMIATLVPKNGVYAELGIFKGDFSKKLYSILQPSKLVLIDLFDGIVGSGDQDGNNFSLINIADVYKTLQLDNRFTFLKGDTSSILATFEDNAFDMVYIDADHSYDGCKKDLDIAFLKVKPGGWIMGHDYEINKNKAKREWVFGVRKAVDEFCKKHNLSIAAKGMDGYVSYAIKIPTTS